MEEDKGAPEVEGSTFFPLKIEERRLSIQLQGWCKGMEGLALFTEDPIVWVI